MPSGKSDQNTIRKIYNQEQLESEEINLDLQDIANGVPLPPNRAHNINKITGGIGTEYFDGSLLSKQGLIKLAMFARRLDEGDPILRYLNSLDDESLMMLGRDFDLDNVMEDMMMEGREEEEEVGMKEEVKAQEMDVVGDAREFDLEEEETEAKREGLDDVAFEGRDDVAFEGRSDDMTNTAILRLLRSLDVSTLHLMVKYVEEMVTDEKNARSDSLVREEALRHQDRDVEKSQDVPVEYQKKTEDALLGDTGEYYVIEKEIEEEVETEEKKVDEAIQFQKKMDDDLLGSSLSKYLKKNEENNLSLRKKDNFIGESKTGEDDRLYELLRDLQELLEDE